MNAHERVKNLLNRVTYKRNWMLDVAQPCGDMVKISLMYLTDDVNFGHPNKTTIGIVRSYPVVQLMAMCDADIIKHIVYSILFEAEKHELDEWFRFDGVCVFDPHPKETGVTK